MKSKSNYEKRLEYNNTYNRNNYRSFSMRLHNENEADLIEWIESQGSVKEYLLSLVKKDGYISKMVNSRNRINEKITTLHVNNTEEICNLMHSFLD